MNGCNVQNILIDSLGSQLAKTVNTVKALNSQGYFVNSCKYNNINNITILIQALESDYILHKDQKEKLNLLVNNFLAV